MILYKKNKIKKEFNFKIKKTHILNIFFWEVKIYNDLCVRDALNVNEQSSLR